MIKTISSALILSLFATSVSAVPVGAASTAAADIASALNMGLLSANLISSDKPIIIPKNKGFEVRLSDMQQQGADGALHEIAGKKFDIVRADDFASYEQFELTDVTLPYLKMTAKHKDPTIQIVEKSATEKLFWVPSLNLNTKRSMNIDGLEVVSPENYVLSADKVVYDALIQPDNKKMNRAAAVDIAGFDFENGWFSLKAPSIKGQTQITDAALTANQTEQFLTASSIKAILDIPALTVVPTLLSMDPIQVQLKNGMEITQNTEKDMTLTVSLNQKMLVNQADYQSGKLSVLFPETITGNISVFGLKSTELKNIVSLREKIDNTFDENNALVAKWEDDLAKEIVSLSDKMVVRVDNLMFKNPFGGVAISGDFKHESGKLTFNGTLSVINIDVLSPDYKGLCRAQKPRFTRTTVQQPTQKEPAICSKSGVFDVLRQYMDMGKRTVTGTGVPQTVDNFDIRYQNNKITINGKPYAIQINLLKSK